MNTISQTIVLGLALTALFACGESGSSGSSGAQPAEPAVVQITAADRAVAKMKFDTVCFTCHGKTGAGDGPASIGLVPQPRNFQDADWQKSVTDQHIEKIIVGGGLAVGKALTMPGNPDLNGKPGVVAALRERIRGLKKGSN